MRANAIYDPKYRAIIAHLIEARKGESLTQKEVADRIGLTQDKVSRIERCQRQLGVMELLNWVEATHFSRWEPLVRQMTEVQ